MLGMTVKVISQTDIPTPRFKCKQVTPHVSIFFEKYFQNANGMETRLMIPINSPGSETYFPTSCIVVYKDHSCLLDLKVQRKTISESGAKGS